MRSASHHAGFLGATAERTTPGRRRMLGIVGVPPGAWILDRWSAKMLSLPDTCRKLSIPYRLDATSKAASRTMRFNRRRCR